MKAVYNMVVAMVILLGMFTFVNYFLDPEKVASDYALFSYLTRNFLPTITIWSLMHASSFIAFQITKLYNNNFLGYKAMFTMYMLYQTAVLLLPVSFDE